MTEKSTPKPAEKTTPAAGTTAPAAAPTPKRAEYERAEKIAFAVVELPDAEDMFKPLLGGSKSSGQRERSDYQKELDALVVAARASEKPVFLECKGDDKSVNDLMKNIRNSGTFTGNGIRFGNIQAAKTKGNVYVSFKVVEKIVKKRTAPKTPVPETPSQTAATPSPATGTKTDK